MWPPLLMEYVNMYIYMQAYLILQTLGSLTSQAMQIQEQFKSRKKKTICSFLHAVWILHFV